jgi:hypothetical protein
MSITRELKQVLASTEQKSEDQRTPLEKHIDYCGGSKPGDYISYTSMTEMNERLGDSALVAKGTAAKVSAGAGMIIKHCPFRQFTAKDAVGKLNHSDHTGIFNLDGTINETVWKELCNYTTVDVYGTTILTKSRFDDFLNARREEEKSSSSCFGRTASNSEWSGYWEKFSRENSTVGKYVTLQELRDFFEDTSKPGYEVEQRVKNRK